MSAEENSERIRKITIQRLKRERDEALAQVEALQMAAGCGCGYDSPDVVCDYHCRIKAEASAKAIEEAAEEALGFCYPGYGGKDWTAHNALCAEIADAILTLKDKP